MVETKPVSYSKTIIVTGADDDDSTGILPDETKLLWKSRIRAAISKLEAPQKRSAFRKSLNWVFNIFGFSALTLSPASPPVSYGTTWKAFASYVEKSEAKLEALEQAQEQAEEDAELQ